MSKKGKWINNTGCLDSMRQYKCSECGTRPIINHNWVTVLTKYCHECGTKMENGRWDR